jgi:hypothetical protein
MSKGDIIMAHESPLIRRPAIGDNGIRAGAIAHRCATQRRRESFRDGKPGRSVEIGGTKYL